MSKNLTSLKTHGELVADALHDEEFRREWDRLAFARAVAVKVIGYRADHDLSQRELAKILGVVQPQVARLENAEVEPSNQTLSRLASKLGMEFTINFAPADREPTQITKRTRDAAVAASTGESIVRYAVA